MANFRELSRYTGGLVTKNRADEDFLILRQSLELEKDDGDIVVTLTQEFLQRPDLLSSQYYGTPDLWWVILEFNGISDPLFGLKLGQVIRIPAFERVQAAIDNLDI